MAKGKNNTKKILAGVAVLGLVITGLTVFAAFVKGKTISEVQVKSLGSTLETDHKVHMKALSTLKKEGCEPAKEVDKRVIVLETKWEAINTSQTELKAGQKEIMKALKK